MALLVRITDFIPSTLIKSQEVDDEFNQLVNLLSGISTNKDTLLKYSHATDPVLRVDQLGAGKIQSWLQNGSEKANITNAGALTSVGVTSTGQIATSFNDGANPALNVNQIGAGLIQRWQNNGTDRATLSALGRLLLPAGVGATPSSDQISNFGTYFVDQALRQTPANTNETDFSSKTMSTNVLAADGDFLIGVATFFTAGNANTKRYRVYFNGTAFLDTTALALNGARAFVVFFILRTSSSAANCIGLIISATGPTTVTQGQSVAATFSNAIIVKSTGQNGSASANDLSQDGFILLKGSV